MCDSKLVLDSLKVSDIWVLRSNCPFACRYSDMKTVDKSAQCLFNKRTVFHFSVILETIAESFQ